MIQLLIIAAVIYFWRREDTGKYLWRKNAPDGWMIRLAALVFLENTAFDPFEMPFVSAMVLFLGALLIAYLAYCSQHLAFTLSALFYLGAGIAMLFNRLDYYAYAHLIFMAAMPLAFWGMLKLSHEKKVKKELLFLIVLGVLFDLLITENFPLIVISLFRVALLILIYVVLLDFKEQFDASNTVIKIPPLSLRSMIILFLSSCLLLGAATIMLEREKRLEAKVNVRYYPLSIPYLSSLYLYDDYKLDGYGYLEASDSLVNSTLCWRIYDAKRQLFMEGVEELEFDSGEFSFFLPVLSTQKEAQDLDFSAITVELEIQRDSQLIESFTQTVSAISMDTFGGEGKYYSIENAMAGYGYADSGNIYLKNTLTINPLRFKTLCNHIVYYDADGNEIFTSGGRGTLLPGLWAHSGYNNYGINYEEAQAAYGIMEIWVEDRNGNSFYKETIRLEKMP